MDENDARTGANDSDPIQRHIDDLVLSLRAEVTKVEQLGEALRSRDVIGQAKGILMERFKIDEGQAFRLLHDASNRTNTKLHEVAQRLVHDGTVGDDT